MWTCNQNSMRYVAWKDRKDFVRDLKAIYQAPTVEAAAKALERFSS